MLLHTYSDSLEIIFDLILGRAVDGRRRGKSDVLGEARQNRDLFVVRNSVSNALRLDRREPDAKVRNRTRMPPPLMLDGIPLLAEFLEYFFSCLSHALVELGQYLRPLGDCSFLKNFRPE